MRREFYFFIFKMSNIFIKAYYTYVDSHYYLLNNNENLMFNVLIIIMIYLTSNSYTCLTD